MSSYSSAPCGGSWRKEGSGETEEERDSGGLLSSEALVREGVGGSCEVSESDGKSLSRLGEGLRDNGRDV
jgi:hypothetical protein